MGAATGVALARRRDEIRRSRASAYSEASIRVLKGLEPVKQRPGHVHPDREPAAHRAGSDRQRGRRGARRLRDAHRRHAARRRLASSSRTTAAAFRSACIRKKACRSSRSCSRGCMRAASSTRAAAAPTAFSGGLHGVGVSVTNALSKSPRSHGLARRQGPHASASPRRRRRAAEVAAAERATIAATRRPARACAMRPIRNTSIARDRRSPTCSGCCAARRCCCRA